MSSCKTQCTISLRKGFLFMACCLVEHRDNFDLPLLPQVDDKISTHFKTQDFVLAMHLICRLYYTWAAFI